MLAANPAFAAILGKTLEDDGGYRVASFTSIEMLTTFLRISPVDVVVLDTDLPGAPAIDIARGLRNHMKLASSAFEIVALTRAAASFHKPLLAARLGDRLTLAEPTSEPEYRPVDRPLRVRTFEPRPVPPQTMGNVIPLFGAGRAPR